MKRAGLLCALVLGACAVAEITAPPVLVEAKDGGAVGLDVYAGSRAAGNPVPWFRGQETLTVRTFASGGAGLTEIEGASCLLDSGVFSARFASPAQVVVPDYGPASPDLFIRCSAGVLSGTATATVHNATLEDRQRAAVGIADRVGGSASVGIQIRIGPASDPDRDDYTYRDVRVTLRPPR
jgi:hypothetical protein